MPRPAFMAFKSAASGAAVKITKADEFALPLQKAPAAQDRFEATQSGRRVESDARASASPCVPAHLRARFVFAPTVPTTIGTFALLREPLLSAAGCIAGVFLFPAGTPSLTLLLLRLGHCQKKTLSQRSLAFAKYMELGKARLNRLHLFCQFIQGDFLSFLVVFAVSKNDGGKKL